MYYIKCIFGISALSIVHYEKKEASRISKTPKGLGTACREHQVGTKKAKTNGYSGS
jgi:hypothetical protein